MKTVVFTFNSLDAAEDFMSFVFDGEVMRKFRDFMEDRARLDYAVHEEARRISVEVTYKPQEEKS